VVDEWAVLEWEVCILLLTIRCLVVEAVRADSIPKLRQARDMILRDLVMDLNVVGVEDHPILLAALAVMISSKKCIMEVGLWNGYLNGVQGLQCRRRETLSSTCDINLITATRIIGK